VPRQRELARSPDFCGGSGARGSLDVRCRIAALSHSSCASCFRSAPSSDGGHKSAGGQGPGGWLARAWTRPVWVRSPRHRRGAARSRSDACVAGGAADADVFRGWGARRRVAGPGRHTGQSRRGRRFPCDVKAPAVPVVRRPGGRLWWLRGLRWLGGIPVHRIHHQARIHHANPGQDAGNRRRAGQPGPQRPAGRRGTSHDARERYPRHDHRRRQLSCHHDGRPHPRYPAPSVRAAPTRHRAAAGSARREAGRAREADGTGFVRARPGLAGCHVMGAGRTSGTGQEHGQGAAEAVTVTRCAAAPRLWPCPGSSHSRAPRTAGLLAQLDSHHYRPRCGTRALVSHTSVSRNPENVIPQRYLRTDIEDGWTSERI
jgi:hypothetical protein